MSSVLALDSMTYDIACYRAIRYVHTLYGRASLSDNRNGRRLGRYPKHVHILRINVLSAMR